MELTRRDAVAALAAAGVVGAGGYALSESDVFEDEERPVEGTAVAVAETIYPSAVENVGEFVRSYLRGRGRHDDAYREGMADAVQRLDDRARTEHDAAFRDLSIDRRDDLLRLMGADTVEPDPDGLDAGRVRFYLINELQYALYTSPTGGELVGIENPIGYPGGTGSYQLGPDGSPVEDGRAETRRSGRSDGADARGDRSG